MNNVVLLLGSNMGDRHFYLEKASSEINRELGKISRYSSVYETAPWGKTEQKIFLNKVVVLSSPLSAEELITRIISIEERMGRIRKEKWEPRVIDIDILFFNDEQISTANLTVPNPGLHERKFTLVPLAELMPGFIHPVLKKSIADILKELNDPLEVKKISNHLA